MLRIRTALALLLAASAAAAAPTAKLSPEKADLGASYAAGRTFDLLLEVDPKGEAVSRDGLRVEPAAHDGVRFGEPLFPPAPDGAYEAPFVVRVPVEAGALDGATLAVRVQGKAAGGEFDATASAKLWVDPSLKGHVTGTAELAKEPAVAGEPNEVVLSLQVEEGYHVYGADIDATEGLPLTAELVQAGAERPWVGGGPASPPGGKIEGAFEVRIPFTPARAGTAAARVLVFWQACTDVLCDPNEVRYLPLSFEIRPGTGEVPVVEAAPKDDAQGGRGGGDFATQGILRLILAAIGAGLFALVMPCTYPLIPITISFFTKQAERAGRPATGLALAYGAGIVAIFVLIGLAVGPVIVQFATNAWVNLVFAIAFLAFGLSLVGLFELRLPGFVNDIAAKASGTGGYLSVLAMGATLVITSFTCTIPFVGGLLVYASESGDLGRVGLAMGVFGLTMAVPFVFLSMSPTALKKLPRSGEWMNRLKVTLGILELGLVLKFVSNIDLAAGTFLIGRTLFLALWSMSFLIAGVYALGLPRVTKGRAIAAAALLALTGYLWSGLSGRPLPFAKIESFLPVIEAPPYSDAFVAVVEEDYERGLKVAQEKGAYVFLHFTGFQ